MRSTAPAVLVCVTPLPDTTGIGGHHAPKEVRVVRVAMSILGSRVGFRHGHQAFQVSAPGCLRLRPRCHRESFNKPTPTNQPQHMPHTSFNTHTIQHTNFNIPTSTYQLQLTNFNSPNSAHKLQHTNTQTSTRNSQHANFNTFTCESASLRVFLRTLLGILLRVFLFFSPTFSAFVFFRFFLLCWDATPSVSVETRALIFRFRFFCPRCPICFSYACVFVFFLYCISSPDCEIT